MSDSAVTVPEADSPQPSRPVRVLLGTFEGLCWAVAGATAVAFAVSVVLGAGGTVMQTARVIDGGPFTEGGAGAVDGGVLDVVLTDVPLSASWPYLTFLVLGGLAWAVLFAMIARVVRSQRHGSPFRSVRPAVLFAFAGVWTALALAGPFVLAETGPRMAQAAGVEIPGATFVYTMTFGDLLSVLAGPLIAVFVGVLTTGSRIWREQRTLV